MAVVFVMVITVAARIAIPVVVLTPLLIASIPPLVIRGVTALPLLAKFHPRMVRLGAAVTVFAHFFRELGFGFLGAVLAFVHAPLVPLTVVSVLPVRNLRNCNTGEKQKQPQR